MLSTWALIVGSLSPACLSAFSKPSRIGWFAPCLAWTCCSYVSAGSASVMQPLSCRSAMLLPPVSSGCQDEFAILVFLHSSTIMSMADLTHTNLPVHNKLILAKNETHPSWGEVGCGSRALLERRYFWERKQGQWVPSFKLKRLLETPAHLCSQTPSLHLSESSSSL